MEVADPLVPLHCPGSGEFHQSPRKNQHQMLEVVKPKYGKLPQHTPTEIEPIDPSLALVHTARIMSLREDLEKNCKDPILLSQVWPSKPDAKQIDRLLKMQARPAPIGD